MTPVLAAVDDIVNWEWIGRNLDTIAERTWQHVYLTMLAVGIGFVVAFGEFTPSHKIGRATNGSPVFVKRSHGQ